MPFKLSPGSWIRLPTLYHYFRVGCRSGQFVWSGVVNFVVVANFVVNVVRCCSATLRRFHVVRCLVLCPKLCHARLDSLSLCYYSPTVCLFALTCPAWQWSPCYPQTAPPPHVFGMGGEIAGTWSGHVNGYVDLFGKLRAPIRKWSHSRVWWFSHYLILCLNYSLTTPLVEINRHWFSFLISIGLYFSSIGGFYSCFTSFKSWLKPNSLSSSLDREFSLYSIE